MRKVRRDRDLPQYVPDYYAESVSTIDFELLAQKGIECVAFDADSTLVPFSLLPFREKHIDAEVLKKLLIARKKFAHWIVASNRPTNDLQDLARSIDADVVRASLLLRKPRKAYYERVIEQAGVHPEKIAMVGDKLVADIFGANRMGLTTVWVKKIGKDNPFDRIFRLRSIEKWLIKRYVKDE